MQSNLNTSLDEAALWKRLEELLAVVDDIRSAALVVGNMARIKDDPDLKKLAGDLYGVHGMAHRRFDEVARELRKGLANDHNDQSEAQAITRNAA